MTSAVGRRDRERADRADRRRVEDRLPGAPGIARLPHTAVHRAEVEMSRLGGHAGDREHAPAAERSDRAPLERLEECRERLGRRARRQCPKPGDRHDERHDTARYRHLAPRKKGGQLYTCRPCAADPKCCKRSFPSQRPSPPRAPWYSSAARSGASQPGTLWVFSNEIDTARSPLGAFVPGALAELTTHRGAFVGYAYVNPHALICARILSRRGRAPGRPCAHRASASAPRSRCASDSAPRPTIAGCSASPTRCPDWCSIAMATSSSARSPPPAWRR